MLIALLAAAMAATAPSESATAIEKVRLEKVLVAAPGVGPGFAEIRRLYPDDWRRFIDGVVELEERKASDEEAKSYSRDFKAGFLSSHGEDLRHAPSHDIALWIKAAVKFGKLSQQDDPKACVASGAKALIPSGFLDTVEKQRAYGEMETAMIDAFRDGQDHPVEHGAPTPEDRALFGRLSALDGATPANAASTDPKDLCANMVGRVQALSELPEDALARLLEGSGGRVAGSGRK